MNIAAQLEELARTERRVAMATLLAARGGSPRPLGAKLFVGEGGRLLGSVSVGGCVDARVIEHGEAALRSGQPARVTVVVDDAEALELGLTCGAEFDLLVEPVGLAAGNTIVETYREAARLAQAGRRATVVTETSSAPVRRALTVDGEAEQVQATGLRQAATGEEFVEVFEPAPLLVIVGASDVAAELTRFAGALGFRVVVIDGRERFAARERFAGASDVLVGMPSELVAPYLHANAWLVLAAHEYKYELPILREALRSPLRYVGMLAGRKRAESVRALLAADGLAADDIARLRAPIGLDIGGREPAEIALSIAAELIAVREDRPVAARPRAPAAAARVDTPGGIR